MEKGHLGHPARQRVWSFECLGLHVAAADSVALVLGTQMVEGAVSLGFCFPKGKRDFDRGLEGNNQSWIG